MLSQAQIQQYHEEGYTIARGVLGAADVAEVADGCDELRDMARRFTQDEFVGVTYFNLLRDCDPFDKKINDVPQIHGVVRRVTYPYGVSKTLNRYRTHPSLLAAVQSLLGPDLVQIVNQVNFNHPGGSSGWGWHQDYRFRKPGLDELQTSFVQCLMAVDRCSQETGGLRIIPGSFRLGGLSLDADIENAENRFDASIAVTPVLEPGDVILFNAFLIHGSTANRSDRQRRVYINGYARRAQCIHGIPVMSGGRIIQEPRGFMEYEQDQAKLPLASKY